MPLTTFLLEVFAPVWLFDKSETQQGSLDPSLAERLHRCQWPGSRHFPHRFFFLSQLAEPIWLVSKPIVNCVSVCDRHCNMAHVFPFFLCDVPLGSRTLFGGLHTVVLPIFPWAFPVAVLFFFFFVLTPNQKKRGRKNCLLSLVPSSREMTLIPNILARLVGLQERFNFWCAEHDAVWNTCWLIAALPAGHLTGWGHRPHIKRLMDFSQVYIHGTNKAIPESRRTSHFAAWVQIQVEGKLCKEQACFAYSFSETFSLKYLKYISVISCNTCENYFWKTSGVDLHASTKPDKTTLTLFWICNFNSRHKWQGNENRKESDNLHRKEEIRLNCRNKQGIYLGEN